MNIEEVQSQERPPPIQKSQNWIQGEIDEALQNTQGTGEITQRTGEGTQRRRKIKKKKKKRVLKRKQMSQATIEEMENKNLNDVDPDIIMSSSLEDRVIESQQMDMLPPVISSQKSKRTHIMSARVLLNDKFETMNDKNNFINFNPLAILEQDEKEESKEVSRQQIYQTSDDPYIENIISRNQIMSPLSPIQQNTSDNRRDDMPLNMNPADLFTIEDQDSEINTGRPLIYETQYGSNKFGQNLFRESNQELQSQSQIKKEQAQELYLNSDRNLQSKQQSITDDKNVLQPIDIDLNQFKDKSLILKINSAQINEEVDKDLGEEEEDNKITIQFRYRGQVKKTNAVQFKVNEFMEWNQEFVLNDIHSNRDNCQIILQAISEDLYRDSFLGICQPLLLTHLLSELQDEGEDEIEMDLILFQDFTATLEIGKLNISVYIKDAKEAQAADQYELDGPIFHKPPEKEVKEIQLLDLKDLFKQKSNALNLSLPLQKIQKQQEIEQRHEKQIKDDKNRSSLKKQKDKKEKDKKEKGKDAKSKATKGGGKAAKKTTGGFKKPKFGGFGKKKGSGGMDEEDLDTLSYKKLIKLITENHPVDPDTKESFSAMDRITVKSYYSKLFDICGFRKLFLWQRNMINKFKKILLNTICKCCRKERMKWPKPKSLEKIPDSDSSDADDEQNKKIQLTLCAENIGEGSTIYLQMMKTFTILFFILSLINFPLYYSYNNSTSNNKMKIKEIWQYFTIGNIGNSDNECSWSSVNLEYLDHQMETLEFECSEGRYISELKYFGFFQQHDLRFNIESKGESFCKAAEYPNEPALYLGTTPLGEEPDEDECDQDSSDPDEECSHETDNVILQEDNIVVEALEESASDGRILQEIKNQSEIPESLKRIHSINYYEEKEEQTYEIIDIQDFQQSLQSDKMYRNLQQTQQDDYPEKECFDCFKSGNRFCQYEKFSQEQGEGQCCNPHTTNCTNEEMPMFCHSDESYLESKLFDASDQFYKAICPQVEMCHRWINRQIRLEDEQVLKFDLIEELYDKEEDQINSCTWWIKPPSYSQDNDQVNIKFKNLGNNTVTIMIVQENKYGELEYIPDMIFYPTVNNKYYKFQLHKLQNDVDKRDQPSLIQRDRPLEEVEAEMEIYNAEKSQALRDGDPSQFSLLLMIEGTEELKQELLDPNHEENELIQLTIQEEKGTKVYSENELETEEQRDFRYTVEYYPLYSRIKNISLDDPNISEIPDDHQQSKTDYNIDPNCQFFSEYDEDTALFRSQEYHDFFKGMIATKCYNQTKCSIQPNFWKQDENEFNYTDYTQDLNILMKLSDNCIQRIRYQKITSREFLMILGCQSDYIETPMGNFHKHNIGLLVVVCDILSIMIITYFIIKVQEMNNEYLEIMDRLQITLQDYSIQLANLKVDKFSQDVRILHMKLWMYFINAIADQKYEGNKMEIFDINLTVFKLPHILSVMKLQVIQEQINQIRNNIIAGLYENPDQEDVQKKKIIRLQEKFDKEKVKYLEITEKQGDRSRQILKKTPKDMKINSVIYVYIIFKHCDTAGICLDQFQYDVPFKDFMKQLFKIDVKEIQRKQFQYNNLNICDSLDPDEVVWENLTYNWKQQRNRKYIATVIMLFLVIGIVIYQMYTGILTKVILSIIKKVDCPVFYTSYDLTTDYARSLALEDYLQKEERQLGLMECYCYKETSLINPWTLGNAFQINGSTSYVCLEMQFMWQLKNVLIIIIDIGVVFINGLIAILIGYLEDFTKHHSRRDLQISAFRLIFILEFLNMGAIQLLSSQKIFQGLIDAILSVAGQSAQNVYYGFTPQWYQKPGLKICLFLFTNSFVSNIGNMKEYIKIELRRLSDRTFQKKLKADPDDPDDDTPNTRLLFQSELEELYTGDVFEGEEAYSRMMSTLFSLLLFSSGMPILYVIGFIFFAGTYITNKIIILKFYTKSTTLTRTIPKFGQQVLIFSVYIHTLLATFMFTNKEVFETKESATQTVEINLKDELEKDIIEADQEDTNYQFFRNRFQMQHQQIYITFVVVYVIAILAGKTIINTVIMIFQFFKFIIMSLMGGVTQCWTKLYCIIEHCLKDEDTETEEEIKDQSYMSSCLSTEQDTLKNYQESDDSSCKHQQQHTGEELLAHLRLALIKSVEKEKKKILSARSKKHQMNNLRKSAILEAKEASFWRNQKMRKLREDYSENISRDISLVYLQKYYQRAKKELVDYLDVFNLTLNNKLTLDLLDPNNTSKMAQLILEVCYVYRITAVQALNFQKILQKRIKLLEYQIDQHYKLITDALVKKKKVEFDKLNQKRQKSGKFITLKAQHDIVEQQNQEIQEMIDNFQDIRQIDYDKKCLDLINNHEELIIADKGRKENRQGHQEICRMQGSKSQSFFILDQPQYAIARKIYFAIEDEDKLDYGDSPEKEGETNRKTVTLDSNPSTL